MNIKDNLTKRGYHIFPNICAPSQIDGLMNALNRMNTRRTPLNEKNHSVWWEEINIPPSSPLTAIILDESLKNQIESEFSLIRDTVFWANRYNLGEYIPKHRDTQGDLQIILPVLLPPSNCGGKLVIHHPNGINEVFQSIGQRLLFQATQTTHETIPITNSIECLKPVRLVCVARIFF
ncbi:MAG: hypothetical protein WA584_14635 [Pyrinomonadaceae bacterium]